MIATKFATIPCHGLSPSRKILMVLALLFPLSVSLAVVLVSVLIAYD
jgi:hypothetical protein